jgi:hypothetical protein
MTSPSWARVRGPLAPYAGGFRAELERLGYTPLTAATHVRLMAHLSRWLARESVEAPELTPAVVDAYFAERRAAGYAGHVTSRALLPLAVCGGWGWFRLRCRWLPRVRRNGCSPATGSTWSSSAA